MLEMDAKKIDASEFHKVITTKADKTAFSELKKQVFSQNYSLSQQITEIASRFDLLKRDQDRNVSLDEFIK